MSARPESTRLKGGRPAARQKADGDASRFRSPPAREGSRAAASAFSALRNFLRGGAIELGAAQLVIYPATVCTRRRARFVLRSRKKGVNYSWAAQCTLVEMWAGRERLVEVGLRGGAIRLLAALRCPRAFFIFTHKELRKDNCVLTRREGLAQTFFRVFY